MERIEKIVAEYLSQGIHISQELVDYLMWFCDRKMEVAKIENKEEYLPLLFEDEIRNYFFREAVNAKTILRQLEKEGIDVCAANAEREFLRATSILTV